MTEIDWRARAEAAEAERDDLRKRLQSCAESVCAEERKTVAAEARIAAVKGVRDRLASMAPLAQAVDAPTRARAKGYANAVELLDAALVEPVGPKEDA